MVAYKKMAEYNDYPEVATPSAAPTGHVRVYAKADGEMYQIDEAGVETSLIGGTIGGTVGVVDNAIPRVDGTGGYTLQGSNVRIDDSDNVLVPAGSEVLIATSAGTLEVGDELIRDASTGLAFGGTLSVNGLDNTKFDIAAGAVVIIDSHTDPENPVYNRIEWTAQTAVSVPSIATTQVSFVGISNVNTVGDFQTGFTATVNGVSTTAYIIFNNTVYDNSELRDVGLLGRLIHPNLTTINAAAQLAFPRYNNFLTSVDGFLAIGTINASGNIYSGVASTLTVNKSIGSTFRIGSNYGTTAAQRKSPNVTVDAATAPTTWFHRYRDGLGGWSELAAQTNVVVQYDDDSGTLQSIPSGKFTIHRLMFFNNTQRHVIQVGQNLYNKLAEAEADLAIEDYENDPNLIDANLRAFLIIKSGTTDLTNTDDAVFIQADNFGKNPTAGSIAGTTTLQGAYDNSVSPEILTDATNGALSVRRGSAADTDSVFEILNGAGSVVANITGEGNADFTALTLDTALPIAEGGTGQTTQTAAFDALAPTTTNGDIIIYNTDNVRLPIGTNGQFLSVVTGLPAWVAAPSGSGGSFAIIRDEKASGTNGGTSASATWNARNMQEISDPDNIVTVVSNEFVPISGDYTIAAFATAGGAAGILHRLRLYNVTAAATVREGLNMTSPGGLKTPATLNISFTANGTDSYRIDHYTQTGQANTGLGNPLSLGTNEIYLEAVLRKEP